MQGLLDFIKTPEGQGLLSAAFGGLAGARRGQPLNSLGRAGLAGLSGYGDALERQTQTAQADQMKQLREMQIAQARDQVARTNQLREAAQSSMTPAVPGMGQVNDALPPELRSPVVQPKPASFDTQGFLNRVMTIDPLMGLEWQQKLVKEPKYQVVGDALVRTDTPEPKEAYRAPAKPEATPTSVREFQYVQENPAYGQWMDRQKALGASKVEVNTGQKGLDNELKIRSDFRSEPIYKAHQEVQSAYAQISTALQKQSPAGDLAGATKIMKLLDPGSVVRESELGMAMAATGALDRLTNYADMIVKGTKLTPNQRKDFQELADRLYGESVKQYNAKHGEYAGFANDYGLNSGRILGPAAPAPKGGANGGWEPSGKRSSIGAGGWSASEVKR